MFCMHWTASFFRFSPLAAWNPDPKQKLLTYTPVGLVLLLFNRTPSNLSSLLIFSFFFVCCFDFKTSLKFMTALLEWNMEWNKLVALCKWSLEKGCLCVHVMQSKSNYKLKIFCSCLSVKIAHNKKLNSIAKRKRKKKE